VLDIRVAGGNPQCEAAHIAKPSRKNVTTDDQAEVFWRSIAAKGAFTSINSGRGVWISLWF